MKNKKFILVSLSNEGDLTRALGISEERKIELKEHRAEVLARNIVAGGTVSDSLKEIVENCQTLGEVVEQCLQVGAALMFFNKVK